MKIILFIYSLLGLCMCFAEQAPERLTTKNFAAVKDYVIGDASDNNYLQVDWKTTVIDGQMASVDQDKPILLWLYFGGPLGNC